MIGSKSQVVIGAHCGQPGAGSRAACKAAPFGLQPERARDAPEYALFATLGLGISRQSRAASDIGTKSGGGGRDAGLRPAGYRDQAPVLAAVGPMQFEVATHRLEAEFGVKVQLDHLPYEIAARTDAAGKEILRSEANVEVMTRVRDEALLAVFPHRWRMRTVAGRYPDLRLDV